MSAARNEHGGQRCTIPSARFLAVAFLAHARASTPTLRTQPQRRGPVLTGVRTPRRAFAACTPVAKPRAANADGGADDAAGMPLAAVDPQKGHGGAATGAVSPQALQESGRRAAAQPGAAAPSSGAVEDAVRCILLRAERLTVQGNRSAGTGRQLADSPLSAGAGTSPDKPQRPARSILKTQPLTTRQRARGSGVRPGGRSGSGSSSEGGSSSESGRSSRADGVLDRILEGADRALQTCFAGLQGAALDAAIRKAFDSAVPEIGGNLDRSLARQLT